MTAPKEQPPPESLRPKDRASQTVWKESADAYCKGGPPKGQSSQALGTDGGGGTKPGGVEAVA